MRSLRLDEMKLVNNISVRVFCKSGEDEELVLGGLRKIVGFSVDELESQKLQIKKSVASGFEDKIKIFEFYVDKSRHVNKILKNLVDNLSVDDKKTLLEQENRLDDNIDFFIRLSKPSILEDSFKLTDEGNCFHIKLNLAVFPKNKVLAREILSKIFL